MSSQAVDDGALLSVLQHLNCVHLAECACVSRQWRAVANSHMLWQHHLQQEFGLLPSCVPALQSNDAAVAFQHILRDPCASVLSDLKQTCDLLSNIDCRHGWSIELQLLHWPVVGQPDNAAAVPPSCFAQLDISGRQDIAPLTHARRMQHAVLHPHHITRSTQGVWLSFTLPDWVADTTAVGDQGAGEAAQTVDLRLCASVSATFTEHGWPASTSGRLAGLQQGAAGTQQLLVIHDPHFHVPASEEELLVLSHRQGLYAWQDESGVYQLVCYLHMEQLLPLAHDQLGLGTAVHGRWGAVPVLETMHREAAPAPHAAAIGRQKTCYQSNRTIQLSGAPASAEDVHVCDSFVLLLACELPHMWLHHTRHDMEGPALVFKACSTAGLWAQLPATTGSEPSSTCPAAARLHACHQLITAYKQGNTMSLNHDNSCSSTGLPGFAARSRLAAAKLQAALDREGMVDFSLYPLGLLTQEAVDASVGTVSYPHCGCELAEGRLLLGRCGVEIWQQAGAALPPSVSSVGQPADCCKYVAHFLVDEVQQPLWANSLEFFFDPAVHDDAEYGQWGFVQLSLTPQVVAKLWGRS